MAAEPSLRENTSDRMESLLSEAIEIADLAERQEFLAKSCGDDLALLQMVTKLVEGHFRAGNFLQTTPGGTPLAAGEQPGDTIGPYQLLEKIGEGGFGVVFLAEQCHPMRRKVALKILKPGMDTAQVLARFESERQALALMEHPHIATVLDGGATAYGRPYFVMELVQGVPITRYCDDHRLSTSARLALFVSVCHAVQHAHQKGIIHRDLKPANILVATYDGQPVPKVIDFGVAKAVGQKLSERTLVTGVAGIIGTLEYMSPEQAAFNAIDVDTRSDIYGLGVLLYELLTGSTPLSSDRIQQAALTDVLRLIREEDPPTPSSRLSDSRDSLAAPHQVEPARRTKEVRGELDWIVMKCLEKQRSRRYETANALARDVQRFLNDEPVEACPPSALYRLRKVARRHWKLLSAAAAFVLLLVSGLAVLGMAYAAVHRERHDKELALAAESARRSQARAALDAMSSQIVEDWLARQVEPLPNHRSFLKQALQFYEEFAADTGQEQESRAGAAGAFHRVASIHFLLGQRREAEQAWKKGQELYTSLVADYPDVPAYRQALAKSSLWLSGLYRQTGRLPEAEAAAAHGTEIQRRLVADFPESVVFRHEHATSLTRLGLLYRFAGRLDEAEQVYRVALQIHRDLTAASPTDPVQRDELGQVYLNLGDLLHIRGQAAEAAKSLREGAAIFEQLAGESPADATYPDMQARSLNNLGNVLRDEEQFEEAGRVFDEVVQIRRQLAADFPAVPEHRQLLAMAFNNLGLVYKDTGRVAEAEEMYRQATAIHRRLAADFPEVADHRNEAGGALINLARILLIQEKFADALPLLLEGEPHHAAALAAGPDNPVYRKFHRLNRWRLAEVQVGLKNHVAAAAAAQQFFDAAFEPPRDAYTTATLLASCVRLAAEDDSLSTADREAQAAAYGERAVAALRRAAELQAAELSGLATDPALDPLRARQDFQEFLPDE